MNNKGIGTLGTLTFYVVNIVFHDVKQNIYICKNDEIRKMERMDSNDSLKNMKNQKQVPI